MKLDFDWADDGKAHEYCLRHAREALGWSQQDVADLLGTTQDTIHRWETGIETPHPSFRQWLCELFEKSPEALDLGDEPEFLLSSTPTYQAILDPWIPLLSHPLVGRDQELARLRQYVCAVPMVTLQGLPGVGKTTLASALVHDPLIRDTFSDGILWVGLGVHPDLQYHLARWGRLLGLSDTELSPLGNEDRQEALRRALEALRRALEARQMLLVIDDAWTEDDARAFQLGGPRCATFITTRFPPLAAAFGSNAQTLRELNTEESLDLLHVLVPQVVEREPEQVRLLAEAHQTNYELLDQESSTLLGALDAAYTLGKQQELVRLARGFVPFLLVRGNYPLALLHLRRAQQQAFLLNNSPALVSLYCFLGDLAGKQGDYDEAQTFLQQGLDLARQFGNAEQKSSLLSLLLNLGETMVAQGKHTQASLYFQETLLNRGVGCCTD